MDNKVGDVVMVRGKITEIRETKKGKFYMVEVDNGEIMFHMVLVPPQSIVE